MKPEPMDSTTNSARYRHANLLVCLLLVIGVSPFFSGSVSWVLEALLFVTLAAGAYATAGSRRMALLLGLLAALSVMARVVHWSHRDQDLLVYGFLAGYITFFSVVTVTLMRSLFQGQDRITADTLCGAISVYLIFGLLWAMAYGILEKAAPGSFLFGTDGVSVEQFDRFLGFSFTTLTTLGYGNVAPATPQADAMATMEAIVGQFYLAVVIARFVALQIVQGGISSATSKN